MTSILPELLDANRRYAESVGERDLPRLPDRRLIVLTCMDQRVSPLRLLGLREGDAHVLRNAGARVTPDTIRSLIVSYDVLGTRELVIIHHTDCGMLQITDEGVRNRLRLRGLDGVHTFEFMTFEDHRETLLHDINFLRSTRFLPADLPISGLLYHVETGRLEQLV